MATDRLPPDDDLFATAPIWVISRYSRATRAIVAADHLMLFSGSGSKDMVRRIYFNRIDTIYSSAGPVVSGAVILDVLYLLLAILVAWALSHFVGAWIAMILGAVPMALLIWHLIFRMLNPWHRIFILRDGRAHQLKITLSKAKFHAFFDLLCTRINSCQGAAESGNPPPPPQQ